MEDMEITIREGVASARPKDVLGTLSLGPTANNYSGTELDGDASGIQVSNPTSTSVQIALYRYRLGTPTADFAFLVPPQSWIRLPVAPYRAALLTSVGTDANNGPIQALILKEPPSAASGQLYAPNQTALPGSGVQTVALSGSLPPGANAIGTVALNALDALAPSQAVLIANVAEAAATAFGSFTAAITGTARAFAASSAAATLNLTGLGQTNALASLTAATWLATEFQVVAGQDYSFQVSAAANVSLVVTLYPAS